MCIIIYSPDGHIPKKHLRASLEANRDGWGLMWPENGELQILIGMTTKEFWHHWNWVKHIDSPKVFHARIGTHGTKGTENCHPFQIPHHGELAVAHNGIIRRQADRKGDKSDTRNFVENILAYLPQGFQNLTVYKELLGDYIGHSKLVFMDGEGEVTIVNESFGLWDGNRWYSNTSYLPWVLPKCKKGKGGAKEDNLAAFGRDLWFLRGEETGTATQPTTVQCKEADMAKLPEKYKPPCDSMPVRVEWHNSPMPVSTSTK